MYYIHIIVLKVSMLGYNIISKSQVAVWKTFLSSWLRKDQRIDVQIWRMRQAFSRTRQYEPDVFLSLSLSLSSCRSHEGQSSRGPTCRVNPRKINRFAEGSAPLDSSRKVKRRFRERKRKRIKADRYGRTPDSLTHSRANRFGKGLVTLI